MKKFFSFFMITILALFFIVDFSYIRAQENEEAVSVFDNSLDLAVPDSPLFTIFGITNQQVNRPSTPREFVTDIFNGITPQGNFETGLAVEFVPFSLLGGLTNKNVVDYRRSLPTQIFSRTSLSFATAKGVTDNKQALRLGLGLRSTLIDKGDPRLDKVLSQCFVSAFNETEELRKPLQSIALETPILEFVQDTCTLGDTNNELKAFCDFQETKVNQQPSTQETSLRNVVCNIDSTILKSSCLEMDPNDSAARCNELSRLKEAARNEESTQQIEIITTNVDPLCLAANEGQPLKVIEERCGIRTGNSHSHRKKLEEFKKKYNDKDGDIETICDIASNNADRDLSQNDFKSDRFTSLCKIDEIRDSACTTEVDDEALDSVCSSFRKNEDCNLVAKPLVQQEAILSEPALVSLDQKLQELQKECREQAKNRNWNRTALVIGAAPTWVSEDGETDNLEWNGIGLWSSLAYGFDTAPFVNQDYYKLYGTDKENEIPWLTKYSQLILGLRYRNDEQVEVPEDSMNAEMIGEMSTMEMMQDMEKKFTHRETFFLGGKLLLGKPNFIVQLEGGYTFVDLDEGKADDIFQTSIGTNFRLTNDLWLELAYGYNNENDDDEMSFLSSLKWALQRKQALGVP